MKNFKQPGDVVTIVAAAVLASGVGVLTGALFGVTQAAAASGAEVEVKRTGVFELPKTSAQAWTVGVKIYWDDTAKVCTTSNSSTTLIGCAAAIAANPSAVGLVLLDGTVR